MMMMPGFYGKWRLQKNPRKSHLHTTQIASNFWHGHFFSSSSFLTKMTSVWFSPSLLLLLTTTREREHIEGIIFRLVQFIHIFLDFKKGKLNKFFPHKKLSLCLKIILIISFIKMLIIWNWTVWTQMTVVCKAAPYNTVL